MMELVSVVASICGIFTTIILGGLAVWLSLYLYRMSTDLNTSIKSILSNVETSSKVTEITATHIIKPIINDLLRTNRSAMQDRISSESEIFTQRVMAMAEKLIQAQTPEEQGAAKGELLGEVDKLFGRIKDKAGKVGPLAKEDSVLVEGSPAVVKHKPIPGSSSYNWMPFVRRIRDIRNNAPSDYLSVRWLREERFSENSEFQEALQIAIDREMLHTYHKDNKHNPKFPILCCELNESHPTVKEILQAISKESTA